ncbi:hypothetical protein [Roseobacter sinensis]|uniref:Uncharacterized protein n=1 Tax=Roseobacter sinensis TaxID=2931391 RepID=A0ABT3BG38_9RHOB|nr:hypothetical protein [Roseobacter sp. WL0113]MCV3272522.1 hypothetical protein [Roseobacter sp. WL0113]
MIKRTAQWTTLAALCASVLSIGTPADAQGIVILKAKKKAAIARTQAPVVVAPTIVPQAVVPVQPVAPAPVPAAPPVVKKLRPGPPIPPLVLLKALN